MGYTFNRFADFGLRIAQKCVWRPGSAWTRWEGVEGRHGVKGMGRGGEKRGEGGKMGATAGLGH